MGNKAAVVAGSLGRYWWPVCTASATTLYEGQLVTVSTDGVTTLGAASGTFDLTNKTNTGATRALMHIPVGVVVGTSKDVDTYSSTYKTNSITSMITSNANLTTDMSMLEGMWGLDKQAYVLVDLIGPCSIIRLPIYNSTFGTAPSVETISTGSATGMGCTTGSLDFTTVANNATFYFRTGANKGLYRMPNTAHATVHTWTSPLNAATAVGDTLVAVNVPSHGPGQIVIDATGMFVDTSAALTNSYGVNVTRLSLSEAGNEYVEFMFNVYQFSAYDET